MKFFTVSAIAAISAVANAEFNEFSYMLDAVKGYSSAAEAILRKPFKLQRGSSSSSFVSYDDKKSDLSWDVLKYSGRGSTRTFPANPSGVEAEQEGIWGSTTMSIDSSGSNWLTIDLEAGWDLKWESKRNNVYDGLYSGIAWGIKNVDDVVFNDDGTVSFDQSNASMEVAIQGASRDSGDSVKATTSALAFDDLIQVITDYEGVPDFTKEGMQIFAGSIDTDARTATSWQVTKTSSSDVVYKGKKYIVGMGVSATRPFEASSQNSRSSSEYSSLDIKNQNTYLVCASQWLAYSNQYGQYAKGCDTLRVNLPVPVPEPEPEPEIIEDEILETQPTESGANSLTMGAAALALYALTF